MFLFWANFTPLLSRAIETALGNTGRNPRKVSLYVKGVSRFKLSEQYHRNWMLSIEDFQFDSGADLPFTHQVNRFLEHPIDYVSTACDDMPGASQR